MNIFKLIFQHDQRLDKLDNSDGTVDAQKMESSIEDFMKPDPTFSSFYFTGTDLSNELFGLNRLNAFDQIINALKKSFADKTDSQNLENTIQNLQMGEAMILTDDREINIEVSDLKLTSDTQRQTLKQALENGHIILYKVQAKDGFDLLMYSKRNVYRDLFFPLQKLVPEHFRFFSINGKKFNTERHFFFETWTLDRPPHGFEEVHPESVL